MSTVNYHLSYSEATEINKTRDTSKIYIGEVMDTRSPTKNGEIKVWLLSSSTNKSDPNSWVTARCGCGIYGNSITDEYVNGKKMGYNSQNTSFGNWMTIPYIGNHVFVFFPCIAGENTIAYWFGSPMLSSNEMLPGIPYDLTQNSDYTPKCEKNYKNPEIEESTAYTPLQNALKVQGLDNDRLRGISTSSSFRDTPSRCYGFLSPLGNQFVIDDGWSLGDSNINWINNPRANDNDNQDKDDYGAYHSKKEWIASVDKGDKDNKLNRFHGGFRFRTRNGTQLLILDAGNIYMINKDGTAWAELSEDGYIDCYSQKGINAASDGNINLHAMNVNIEALNKVSIKAGSGISMETDGNVMVKSGSMNVSDRISVPSLIADKGQIGVFKSPMAEVTGTFSGTLQGTAYYATAAGFQPIEQKYPDIDPMTSDSVVVTKTVAVKQQVGSGDIYSIASRVPTHEPWSGHDKNESIPPLLVKQMMKKTEKEPVNNTVPSNQVRR